MGGHRIHQHINETGINQKKSAETTLLLGVN